MSYKSPEELYKAIPEFCRNAINDPDSALKAIAELRASPCCADIKNDDTKPADLFKVHEDKFKSVVMLIDLLGKFYPAPTADFVNAIIKGLLLAFMLLSDFKDEVAVQYMLLTLSVKILRLNNETFVKYAFDTLLEFYSRLIADFGKDVIMMEIVCHGYAALFPNENPEEVGQINELVAELTAKTDNPADVGAICEKMIPLFSTDMPAEIDVLELNNLLQTHSSNNAFVTVANKALNHLLGHNKYVAARKGFKASGALVNVLNKYLDKTDIFKTIAPTFFALLEENPELATPLWDDLVPKLMAALDARSSDKVFMLHVTSILRRFYEVCDDKVAAHRNDYKKITERVFKEYTDKEDDLLHLNHVMILQIEFGPYDPNKKPEEEM